MAPGVGGLAVLVRTCLYLLSLLLPMMRQQGSTGVARALMTPRYLQEGLRGLQPAEFVRLVHCQPLPYLAFARMQAALEQPVRGQRTRD